MEPKTLQVMFYQISTSYRRLALALVGLLFFCIPVLNAQSTSSEEELISKSKALYHEGKPGEAISVARQAASLAEKNVGLESLEAVRTLLNLAELFMLSKRYPETGMIYKHVLEIYENKPEGNHLGLITSITNLGKFYVRQKRYSEAKPYYNRALALDEKKLGADHILIATHFDNFAKLYLFQNLYDKAEFYYQRVLSMNEKAYGSDHPDVAASLNNLTILYSMQGRLKETDQFLRRSGQIFVEQKNKLGKNDYRVKSLRHNLELAARSRTVFENYKEARFNTEIFLGYLAKINTQIMKYEKVESAFGPLHPLTRVTGQQINQDRLYSDDFVRKLI